MTASCVGRRLLCVRAACDRHSALKYVLRDEPKTLARGEALLFRAKEGNDTPRYWTSYHGHGRVYLYKKTLNFNAAFSAHGYPIPEITNSFDCAVRPYMLSELEVRHQHELRTAAVRSAREPRVYRRAHHTPREPCMHRKRAMDRWAAGRDGGRAPHANIG